MVMLLTVGCSIGVKTSIIHTRNPDTTISFTDTLFGFNGFRFVVINTDRYENNQFRQSGFSSS